MTATAICPAPEPDRPVIIGRWSHWRRLRWPDGTVEIASAARARRLGAIDREEPDRG